MSKRKTKEQSAEVMAVCNVRMPYELQCAVIKWADKEKVSFSKAVRQLLVKGMGKGA